MAESKSATTVTVASKLPNAFKLRIFKMVEVAEPVMGGGTRMVKQSQELPDFAVVFGCSHPQNMAPRSEIAGGYGLTPNVPKQIWDTWLEQNKDSMLVKNRIIFAQPSAESVRDQAGDQKEVRSGLERLQPKDFKRMGIETDKDQMNKDVLAKLA